MTDQDTSRVVDVELAIGDLEIPADQDPGDFAMPEGPAIPSMPSIPPMPSQPPTVGAPDDDVVDGQVDAKGDQPADNGPDPDDDAEEDIEQADPEPTSADRKPGKKKPTGKTRKSRYKKSAKRKSNHKRRLQHSGWNPRLRFLLYNGTAAATGWGLGLEPKFTAAMQMAGHAPTGTLALVMACVAVPVPWRVLGHPAAARILPFPEIARPLGTAATAGVAAGCAPAVLPFISRYGVNLAPVFPVLASAGMCGLLWFVIDRRARYGSRAVAWFFRIPLATAVLTFALHAPGTH